MRLMILSLMLMLAAGFEIFGQPVGINDSAINFIKTDTGSMVDKKPKKARLSENFTLRKGETVELTGTDFGFTFEDIEYESLMTTSRQEIHYYRLHIKYRGDEKSEILKDNIVEIDNYQIHCRPPFGGQKISFTVTKK